MTDSHSPVPRWPYLLLRGTSTALAVLGVAQAAFAGSFLSGHYDVLLFHSRTAMVMVGLSVAQLVVVLLARRAAGVPRSVLMSAVMVPVLLAAQSGLGMGRILVLHVPLGVLMIGGMLRQAAFAWRNPPAQAPATVTRDEAPVGALS